MMIDKRRSYLGQARGDGSAHQGSHHWIVQRVTSVALVVLGLWLFYSFATVNLSSYAKVVEWLQNPISFSMMMLTLLVGLYHTYLGMQVVLEDYVHHEGVKFLSLVVMKLGFAFLALASFYSLIKIQSIVIVPGFLQAFANSALEACV